MANIFNRCENEPPEDRSVGVWVSSSGDIHINVGDLDIVLNPIEARSIKNALQAALDNFIEAYSNA